MNWIAALLLLTVLPGCYGQVRPGSSPAVKEDKDYNRIKTVHIKCQPVVEISRDDTLVIEFIQYPGRAYSWELMTADSSLINLKLVKINHHDSADRPDSQEKVEFFFQGLKEGEENLTFTYFRPWERNKPAADSCIIKIKIK